MKHFAFLAMLCMILLCATQSSYAEDYIVKPGDNLGVIVLGEPELTKRVIVDPRGKITMPLINEVEVAGLTPSQAAQEITARLKRFMKNPQVSVELLETARVQVTVSGEVRSPGIYVLVGGARLLDAITSAGGYTAAADLSKIAISHAGMSEKAVTVDLSKFLLSGDVGMNVAINHGDTVFVPARESGILGTVTLLGAVRQPGQHPITQGMTLREVVMLAGGPTEVADLGNVTLRREGAESILIDYARAASGDASANLEIKPGDVVYVAAREQFGFYTIQGAVARPGRYEVTGNTSLTEAIAIAGGVRDRAKLKDVRILRSSNGQTVTLNANVSDIMAGKADNIPIRDSDHIYIAAGKPPLDIFRVASLALSLAWLLSRR